MLYQMYYVLFGLQRQHIVTLPCKKNLLWGYPWTAWIAYNSLSREPYANNNSRKIRAAL